MIPSTTYAGYRYLMYMADRLCRQENVVKLFTSYTGVNELCTCIEPTSTKYKFDIIYQFSFSSTHLLGVSPIFSMRAIPYVCTRIDEKQSMHIDTCRNVAEPIARFIVRDVAQALVHLHEDMGIAHRDLKPQVRAFHHTDILVLTVIRIPSSSRRTRGWSSSLTSGPRVP